MLLTVAVVALIGIGVVLAARVAVLASACHLHEAREGTGYENQVGRTVDEFRSVVWLPFVVKAVEADQPPGTIVRVSACGAPGGSDLVVYTARR